MCVRIMSDAWWSEPFSFFTSCKSAKSPLSVREWEGLYKRSSGQPSQSRCGSIPWNSTRRPCPKQRSNYFDSILKSPNHPLFKTQQKSSSPIEVQNKQVVWYKSKSSLCQFHFQSTWSLASHDSSTWTYTYLSMPLLSLCESWSCSGVVGSLSIWRWILLWGICFRTRAHIYWFHPFQCHKGIARCNV